MKSTINLDQNGQGKRESKILNVECNNNHQQIKKKEKSQRMWDKFVHP